MVDAGSGFEAAGRVLAEASPDRLDLLLSHLHHDHIAGLPFFTPILIGQCGLHVHCGNLGGETAKIPLDRMFSPPLFPIGLDQLPVPFCYSGFEAGETLTFENGIRIGTCLLHHPGGATGYRFEHRGRSVCYVSDIEHGDAGPDPKVVRFCRGADLVIYDAMFTRAEYPKYKGWGHSTWEISAAPPTPAR